MFDILDQVDCDGLGDRLGRLSSTAPIQCLTGRSVVPWRCAWQPMLAVRIAAGDPRVSAVILLAGSRYADGRYRLERNSREQEGG